MSTSVIVTQLVEARRLARAGVNTDATQAVLIDILKAEWSRK